MIYRFLIACAVLFVSCETSKKADGVKKDTAENSLLGYVDPNIGTAHSRWFFYTPASMPFGMAKLGPSTNGSLGNEQGWEATGYDSRDNTIEGFANLHEFQIGGFHLNSKLRFLTYNEEEPIKLSPKENELLRLLALHENDLMPRELALTKIWRDDNYFTSRSMDVYIAKLRKYLKKDENVEILNIHGEGFRLVIKNKEEETKA